MINITYASCHIFLYSRYTHIRTKKRLNFAHLRLQHDWHLSFDLLGLSLHYLSISDDNARYDKKFSINNQILRAFYITFVIFYHSRASLKILVVIVAISERGGRWYIPGTKLGYVIVHLYLKVLLKSIVSVWEGFEQDCINKTTGVQKNQLLQLLSIWRFYWFYLCKLTGSCLLGVCMTIIPIVFGYKRWKFIDLFVSDLVDYNNDNDDNSSKTVR